MKDIEEIRTELLTARAMQSLSKHNGFIELASIWDKIYKRLEAQITSMEQWDALALGRWQGQMQIIRMLVRVGKDAKERIPQLEDELRTAEKSARIPRILSPNAKPPTYGAT